MTYRYYQTEENRSDDDVIWNNKSRQLRIDCVGASKGLFLGLIFFTSTLLCLVLFFIFTPQPQFHRLGLFLIDAAHCSLLVVSLFAIVLGAYRYVELLLLIGRLLCIPLISIGLGICIFMQTTWKSWAAFCFGYRLLACLHMPSFR